LYCGMRLKIVNTNKIKICHRVEGHNNNNNNNNNKLQQTQQI